MPDGRTLELCELYDTVKMIVERELIHKRRGEPMTNDTDRIFTSLLEEAGELVQAHRKYGLPDDTASEEVEELSDCLIALLHYAVARDIKYAEIRKTIMYKLTSSFVEGEPR